jgi:hypothetical protein
MATIASHIDFARKLTTLMDTKFTVLWVRFGIDPILQVIPGFGNFLAAVTSCYLFWIAYRLRVPTQVYARMAINILFDYLMGFVPLVGIVFDILYRSNIRNFALLEKYFDPEVIEGEIER